MSTLTNIRVILGKLEGKKVFCQGEEGTLYVVKGEVLTSKGRRVRELDAYDVVTSEGRVVVHFTGAIVSSIVGNTIYLYSNKVNLEWDERRSENNPDLVGSALGHPTYDEEMLPRAR